MIGPGERDSLLLPPMPTIAELILARADDDRPALLFEDRAWSWREYVRECVARAHLLLELRRAGPFHVAVLLDNVPEYPMLLGAAASCSTSSGGAVASRASAPPLAEAGYAPG
jgi:fatty-acyl-CoA synthase